MNEALNKIDKLKRDHKVYDKHVAHILGISDVTIRRWRLPDQAVPDWVEPSLNRFNKMSKKKQAEEIEEARAFFEEA